jgi:Flp pilus assembly CpaF family ATPase
MRPDRLVVGEVRQEESLDLLIALNSGLPGMCSMQVQESGRGPLTRGFESRTALPAAA